jgi:hypothetical protein
MRQVDYIHLMLMKVNLMGKKKTRSVAECLSCDASGALAVTIKKRRERREKETESIDAD